MNLHLLQLHNVPIWEQLRIEEALLRADDRNWCIINTGSPDAIVMGISGKPEQLIDMNLFQKNPIPLIKRFSGGGTVYIDPDTYFITLIFNNRNMPQYPQEILKWTEQLYKPVFSPLNFTLTENDYTVNGLKFGGNAQYLCKNRWLHHTSLLWRYDSLKMNLLLLPSKRPTYRQDRTHEEFLCTLEPHFSKEEIQNRLLTHLSARFSLSEVPFSSIGSITERPHRKTTLILKSQMQ